MLRTRLNLTCVMIVTIGCGWLIPHSANGQATPSATPQVSASQAVTPTPRVIRLGGGPRVSQPMSREEMAKRKSQNPRVYSSRPMFVVGTIKSIDSATSSVLLAIDRERSSIPHGVQLSARRAGTLEKLGNEEFPPEREFKLSRTTFIYDARPDANKPATRADTGKMRDDKQRLSLADFKPGEFVGIRYRMGHAPGSDAFVINLCKLDPKQDNFDVDNLSPSFSPKRLPVRKGDAGTTRSLTPFRVKQATPSSSPPPTR